MLDSLKEAGRNVGRELNRAWESLSDGWRELLSRSGNALTHFSRNRDLEAANSLTAFPRWSLLAGEVEETGTHVVVRVEMPGLEKEDCKVSIDDHTLYIYGEKHFQRETRDSIYHITERAYGTFERTVQLPRDVDLDQAQASYRNGVLTVRLPKQGGGKAKTVPVS